MPAKKEKPEWARALIFESTAPLNSTPADVQEGINTDVPINMSAEPQIDTYTDIRNSTYTEPQIDEKTEQHISIPTGKHKRINTGMYAREDLLEKCRVGAFLSKPRRSLADVLDEAMEDIIKKYNW